VDQWKAVKLRQGGAWQLFDLDVDGTETDDLAKREPERLQELASRFEAWRDRVGAE
jgi:arylsulfatase